MSSAFFGQIAHKSKAQRLSRRLAGRKAAHSCKDGIDAKSSSVLGRHLRGIDRATTLPSYWGRENVMRIDRAH